MKNGRKEKNLSLSTHRERKEASANTRGDMHFPEAIRSFFSVTESMCHTFVHAWDQILKAFLLVLHIDFFYIFLLLMKSVFLQVDVIKKSHWFFSFFFSKLFSFSKQFQYGYMWQHFWLQHLGHGYQNFSFVLFQVFKCTIVLFFISFCEAFIVI